MAITQSGITVTFSGYFKGSYNATGGTITTITGSGLYTTVVGRTGFIISGTGAGAIFYITAATSGTYTASHGFWLPGSNGKYAEQITPDATSVFVVAWNCADAVSAVPTYCSFSGANNREMVCTQNIAIAASSAFADVQVSITLSTDKYTMSSVSTGHFAMGYINSSGKGVYGGILSMILASGTVTVDTSMLGWTYILGSVINLRRTISKHMRWNLSAGGDGMAFINSRVMNFGVFFRGTDVVNEVTCDNESFIFPDNPLVLGSLVITSGNLVSNSYQTSFGNYSTSLGIAGGDLFDFKFYGEETPIYMYGSRANEDKVYLWRTNPGTFTDLTTLAVWTAGTHDGTLYLGTTVDVGTFDSGGSALGTVKVGIMDASSGNGVIVTAKDGTTHVPTFSRFITTDGSGAYTGPWGTNEGMGVLYGNLVYASTTTSTLNQYHSTGVDLVFTKYGYIQQRQSRSYGYKEGGSESAFLLADAYTSAAYATAIAYTGMAWTAASKTLVLSSAHSVQHIYDYMHAKMDYEAGTNDVHVIDPITTLDGATATLTSGWKITDDGYIDYTSWKLTGGTLIYTTAGTYSPVVDTLTLEFSAASGSFDLSSATISGTVTLVNTGGGSLDVYLPDGTSYVNTGPNITVHAAVVSQGLAFTGLVAGSQVVVFTTGTQTELYRDNSSGTTSTFSQTRVSDITVDYTVMKAGYLPIRVTGVLLTTAVIDTPISQTEDRAYTASSGLTYGTTATVNTTTKVFTLGAASTTQNWYSFWIEEWISQAALTNTQFPLFAFGPYSVALRDGYEFSGSSDIVYLSRGGIRYRDTGGTTTAIWGGFLSVGTMTGIQAHYQQVNGSGTASTAATGVVDQLIQIYGDATHGNFDYTAWLVFKAQKDGYDQAEADVYVTYGTLEDELYVFGLKPTANGVTTGDPALANPPTITDHGASPVTWHSKTFSITITDSAAGNSGADIMQWIRYNIGTYGTFQGKNYFNWHDLVQENGTKYKTVRGNIWGGAGAAIKGVRVVQNDGTTEHADFSLYTSDDGSTYASPVYQQVAITGINTTTRVQIYDTTSSTELYNDIPGATSYTWTDPSAASASRVIRIRLADCVTTTAYGFVEVSAGTCGTTDADYKVTYNATLALDAVYNSNAIDGSGITGITVSPPSPTRGSIAINRASGTVTWADIYAYTVYWLYTATGIADENMFIEAVDNANYILTSWDIKNTNAAALTITGGWGRDSSTLTIAGCIDAAGSTGNIYAEPDHVVSYAVGSALTAGQDAALTAIKGVTDQFSFTVANQVDANALTGGGGLDAAGVRTAVGLASANLDTQLGAIPTAAQNAVELLAEAATTPIAANVKKVNDVTILGDGSATPFHV